MTSVSLYDISGRFYELMARAAADESLTVEELDEQYNELCHLLQTKTPGIVGYYRNVEASINAVDAEVKRLTALKQRMEKHQENYRQYVKNCMDRMELVELSTDLGKLKITKNPVSIEVMNIKEVPDEYVKTSLTIKGDRDKINLIIDLSERNFKLLGLETVLSEQADKNKIASNFKETGEIIPGTDVHDTNTRLEFK